VHVIDVLGVRQRRVLGLLKRRGLAGFYRKGPKGSSIPNIDSNASIAYMFYMAALTIRNLPDDVRDRLRVRAAERGRSMEAEARAILTEALVRSSRTSAEELQALVAQLYGADPPTGGADALIKERRAEAIRELLADGLDPADVLGEGFERVCAEAGLDPAEVRRAARRTAR
jgi:plasmid stability protein